jgi:hypothetical protein
MRWKEKKEVQAPSIKHQASSIKHQAASRDTKASKNRHRKTCCISLLSTCHRHKTAQNDDPLTLVPKTVRRLVQDGITDGSWKENDMSTRSSNTCRRKRRNRRNRRNRRSRRNRRNRRKRLPFKEGSK